MKGIILKTAILFVALSLLSGCSLIRKKDIEVRPITLRVVDHETGSPLEGIPVIYSLDKYQVSILPFPFAMIYMESPYYDEDSIVESGEFLTDEKGEVHIPAKHFRYNERTHIGYEIFFINLHPNKQGGGEKEFDRMLFDMLYWDSRHFDPAYYYTPVPSHRGYYIEIMNFEGDTSQFGLLNKELSDYLYLDAQSFQKNEEVIKVYLRRR